MASTADNTTDALNVPAMLPPQGSVSNFDNPYNRGYILTAVGSLLISLMITFVAVRMYAKTRIQKKLWWDDLSCGLAAATAIVYFVACILSVQNGVGIHQWNIKASSLGHGYLIATYITVVLAAPALGFAKITFFLMYYQIFRPKITLRYLIYIGGIATAIFYTGSTIAQFIFMTPRPGETFLTHFLSPFQLKINYFSVPHSAVGAGIDLYILVLPIVAVVQLQLATKQKIGIVIICMTGSFAVMASFLSMYYRILLRETSDLTWAVLPVILLCLAEMCIGVMCTCMPSLSVTLRHHASQFATFRSSISSGFNYFSDLRSRSAPFTKPESLTPYPRKAKKVYSELEMSTSAYRGDRHRSLEESQQYDVESLGTKKSRAFVGEEDRIYLRQDVTVSRQ